MALKFVFAFDKISQSPRIFEQRPFSLAYMTPLAPLAPQQLYLHENIDQLRSDLYLYDLYLPSAVYLAQRQTGPSKYMKQIIQIEVT